MTRAMILMAACGLVMAAGCEDKKADPAKTMGDAAKSAGDAMKTAADKTATATKDAANAGMDKVKDAGAAVMAEAKDWSDKAKAKIDALTSSGSSLTPDKKPAFDTAMTAIKGQYQSISDGVAKLKDQSGDAMAKGWADLKDKGTKLMDSIKSTADKFGLKA